jgi:hypothetical protein
MKRHFTSRCLRPVGSFRTRSCPARAEGFSSISPRRVRSRSRTLSFEPLRKMLSLSKRGLTYLINPNGMESILSNSLFPLKETQGWVAQSQAGIIKEYTLFLPNAECQNTHLSRKMIHFTLNPTSCLSKSTCLLISLHQPRQASLHLRSLRKR